MKKLLVYIKDFRLECVLAPLFKLLEASFELIVPLIMAGYHRQGHSARATRGFIVRMCAVAWSRLGGVGLAQFRHRAVFLGQGGRRLFRQAAACAHGAYPDA